MRLVSEPSTIHYFSRMSRPFNIKKSIQYPQKQLPCQIPGGSVQYILSKALTQTDLKLRGCSHVSAPDRMLFINRRLRLQPYLGRYQRPATLDRFTTATRPEVRIPKSSSFIPNNRIRRKTHRKLIRYSAENQMGRPPNLSRH